MHQFVCITSSEGLVQNVRAWRAMASSSFTLVFKLAKADCITGVLSLRHCARWHSILALQGAWLFRLESPIGDQ